MYRKVTPTLLTLVMDICLMTIPAMAQNTVTNTATVPLSGAIFDEVTGECVNFSGALNVVTQVTTSTTGITLDLHAALPANVTATGASGSKYIANGAARTSQQLPPGTTSVNVPLTFVVFKPKTPPVKFLQITLEQVFVTSLSSPIDAVVQDPSGTCTVIP